MAVIDGTIVSASLTPIADDLGATIGAAAWFTSAYLLAAGVTMPLSGWIIEQLTPRRTLIIALVLFVAGSVLCAMANSAPELIAFRVIQGFGGGLLEPTALTIAAASAGASGMGRTMGIVSAVINIAPIIGPLAGSALAGAGWWQLIFLLNLPLGVIVLIGAVVVVGKIAPPAQLRRPDLVGALLLPAGFVSFLLAIESIDDPARVSVLAIVGLVVLVGYAVRAMRNERPAVLDLRLLRISGFRAGLAIMAAVGFTMYFQLVGLALFAERHLGLRSVEAGALVAALGAGCLISMTVAGFVSDRVGARRIVMGAAASAAAAALLIVVLVDRLGVALLAGVIFAFGLAFGAVAAPSFASVYRTVPPDRIAHATPSLFVSVQLCAALGAAAAAGLMTRMAAVDALVVGYSIVAGLMICATAVARQLPGRQVAF